MNDSTITATSVNDSTGAPSGAPGANAVVAWTINREVALVLGSGLAILLQFAHPLVAAGVAEHSTFSSSTRKRLRRLHRTLAAMLALTFGTDAEALRAARGINGLHDRVHGRLREGTPAYAAGTSYDAHDPALLAWVHATVVDAALRCYELYVGPLTPREKDQYCAEAAGIAPLLGIPEGTLPASAAELDAYMSAMLARDTIAVTETARMLARDVLYPPFPLVLRPLLWPIRLSTIGLLPPHIRAAYGYRWDARREWALRLMAWLIHHLLPLTPPPLRYWPMARRAAHRRAHVARRNGDALIDSGPQLRRTK